MILFVFETFATNWPGAGKPSFPHAHGKGIDYPNAQIRRPQKARPAGLQSCQNVLQRKDIHTYFLLQATIKQTLE